MIDERTKDVEVTLHAIEIYPVCQPVNLLLTLSIRLAYWLLLLSIDIRLIRKYLPKFKVEEKPH